MRATRRLIAAAAALAVFAVAPAPVSGSAPVGQPAPRSASTDLPAALDAAVADLPARSCLAVSVEGRSLHRIRADADLVPASTHKLLVSTIALDVLGEDHRFTTRVLASQAPAAGTVEGDLYLLGGGDPLLSTDVDRLIRSLGDDHHPTSLDELADRVAAAGIRRVTGRVVGDESRYDAARTVATWPDRFVEQGQAGPLSALSVDDGYRYDGIEEDAPNRVRSDHPATAAATAFTELLRDRGIAIGGPAGEGTAPANAIEVSSLEGAPLPDVLAELLTFSDNQTGELITKEIGLVAGSGGTTAAGVEVLQRRGRDLGLIGPDTVVTDGSGLDEGNRTSCDDLISVLDAGGPDGPVGRGLAVADRTGTLRNRLEGPLLSGRVRAKTGNLRSVTSLAGFAPLASGEVATFAMITNDVTDPEAVWRVQTAVARSLVTHTAACPDEHRPPLVLPGGLYSGSLGTIAMVPLPAAVLPATVVTLNAFEDGRGALVDRCRADDEDFAIVPVALAEQPGT